jgi:hypothetical protein
MALPDYQPLFRALPEVAARGATGYGGAGLCHLSDPAFAIVRQDGDVTGQ